MSVNRVLLPALCGLAMLFATSVVNASILINELHYDNASTDAGEFIEVITTAGEDPNDITVSLYNGADSELYGFSPDTFNLAADFVNHGILTDGNRYFSRSFPVNGLQNGAPDGIAVDLNGTVQEFLSYEGVIAAAGDGPAVGFGPSTDIGVEETSSTPLGSSLQRFGSLWVVTDGFNTQGAVNIPEPATCLLMMIGVAAMISRRRL